MTGAAGHVARDADGGLDTGHRLAEIESERGLEVGAALGAVAAAAAATTTTATTEHAAEQIGDVAALEVEPSGTGTEAGARPTGTAETGAPHGTHGPDLVVLLALGLVADDVVRGRDLLEAFLGGGIAGVGVGMQLTGQLAVRTRDVLRRRLLGDAEDLVVVLLEPFTLWCHYCPAFVLPVRLPLSTDARGAAVGVIPGPSPWRDAARVPSSGNRCAGSRWRGVHHRRRARA